MTNPMLAELDEVVRIDRDKRVMYAEGEMRTSDVLRRRFQVEAANFLRTHHATLADMAKRLEAAERDAARYRWISSKTTLVDDSDYVLPYVSAWNYKPGAELNELFDSFGQAIDAAQEGAE